MPDIGTLLNPDNLEYVGGLINTVQDIHPGSSPSFASISVGSITFGGHTFTLTDTDLEVVGGTDYFTITAGNPTARTLIVSNDCAINQNVTTTATPTFASLIATTATITLNGNTLTVSGNSALDQNLRIADSPTFAALTSTSTSMTFGANTLTVSGSSSLNQSLLTTSSPTFQTLTLSHTSPRVTLTDTDDATSNFDMTISASAGSGQFVMNARGATSSALIDLNPLPLTSGQQSTVRCFRTTNTTGSVIFDIYNGDGTGTVAARLSGNSVQPSYVCLNGGNFGIGALPSSNKFYISDSQGGASGAFAFLATVTSGYTATFSLDNTSLSIGHNSSSRQFDLQTNSITRLRVTSTGRVGISQTALSPTGQLGVAGDLEMIGVDALTNTWITNQTYSRIYTSAAPVALAYPFDVYGHLILQPRSNAARDIVFATGSGTPAVRMAITSAGVVNINSSGGSELFRVNGSVGFYNASIPYFLASQSSNNPTIQFGSSSASSTNLTFVSSTTSGQNINFNDTGSNKGVIHYNHNANYMEFSVETASMGRIYNTGWAIGTSFAPTYLFHMRTSSATQRLWADFQIVGQTAMSQTHPGIFITAGAMNTTNKYTPGLLFGSTDTDFTTTNPKFLAGITAEATQTYSSDLTGGMALNFWTSPNAAGATPVPLQRMRIDEVGRVGIKKENPVSSLHVFDINSSSNQSGITIEDGGTGDPILHLLIAAGSEYCVAVDNSINDNLVIGGGPTPDTLPIIVSTTAGEVTFPLSPAFMAYRSSSLLNVTGNGTYFTIIFNVETFDQNSDYNTSTGVFTAPVSGRYSFKTSIYLQEVGSGHTHGQIALRTSNDDFLQSDQNTANTRAGTNLSMIANFFVNMDAADTAFIQIYVAGSTLTVDVFGQAATPRYTVFSGFLQC